MQIFISYTSRHNQDKNVAQELYEKLKEWGYKPWMDIHDIPNFTTQEHDGWQMDIDSTLETSQVMIALMSDESITSPNVKREWLWAKNNNLPTIWVRVREFDKPLPHQLGQPNYIPYKSQDYEERLKKNLSDIKLKIDIEYDSDIISYNNFSKQHGKDFVYEILDAIKDIEEVLKVIPQNKREQFIRRREKLENKIICWRIAQAWFVNILKPTLEEFAYSVNMNSELQPNLVVKYDEAEYKTTNYTSNQVRNIYEKLGMFLVLGEPGSGKSIFLLQLATLLMKNYLDCITKPNCNRDYIKIPLVLNLSSWGSKADYDETSLEQWVALECEKLYRIDSAIFEDLLSIKRFVLLLDGLDEIPKEKLVNRIQKINEYRLQKQQDVTPIIVCSRSKDYQQFLEQENQDCKLLFTHSVHIAPLDKEEILAYLDKHPDTRFNYLFNTSEEIQELAKIPLFLVMMARVYSYKNFEGIIVEKITSEDFSEDIIDKYTNIKDQYSSFDKVKKVKRDNILGWLTVRSRAYGVIFRLDRMTIDWYEKWMIFIHNTILLFLIFIVPVLLWLSIGIDLAGIIGGLILAINTGIFSRVIWHNFYREGYFYHNIHYKNFIERLEYTNNTSRIRQLKVFIDDIFFSSILFPSKPLFNQIKADAFLRWFSFLFLISIWLLWMTYFFSQFLAVDFIIHMLSSSIILIIVLIVVLVSKPETAVTSAFRNRAFTFLILSFGIAIGLCLLLTISSFVIAIPLTLALFLGVARIVQLQLFGIFFWIKFRSRYQTFMNYMVMQNVFRKFAGGYTYRHDYFFQRHWEPKNKNITIKQKFDEIMKRFDISANYWHNTMNRSNMLSQIQQLGNPAIEWVVNAFITSEHANRIEFLADALIGLGQDSAKSLFMKDEIFDEQKGERNNYDTLHHAIRVWSALKYNSVVDKLIENFNHKNLAIRQDIANALGIIGTDIACRGLIEKLESNDIPEILRVVVNALCQLKDIKPSARLALEKYGYDCE